ncbi:hypothetical protein [Iodidimonas sp. SYSU 1G8]|uniref:terminase small subunit-like protein n=1 Tax=Iodidimonas sp. SYSU 1G8 TaxID=3133967 RepID=UPI0031FF1AFA
MRVLGKVGMEVVCQHMAAGKSLGAIAALLNIETDALLTFVKQPENAARYEAARAERAVALVEQALDIVDAADAGDVRIVKLRVDTRKWLAAYLDPGRYGDGRSVTASVGVDAAHLDLLRRMAGGEEEREEDL